MSHGLVRHIAPWEVVAPGWLARATFAASRIMRYAVGFALGLLVCGAFSPVAVSWCAGLIIGAAVVWTLASLYLRRGARRHLDEVLAGTSSARFRLLATPGHMIWVFAK